MSFVFDKILDAIVASNSTRDAIRIVQDAYDHDFTTFHLLVNPAEKLDNPFVRTTYPDAWVTHYLLNNYAGIDPILERALSEGDSFGWHELEPSANTRMMFKAAARFGIGASGYSFVYEDRRGRRGVFSLNSGMEQAAWIRYITPLVDQFETMLPILHSKAVSEATSETSGAPVLTRREYECLRLSSEGKSYSEIAIILSLSDHTVRSYLKLARIKLDCVSLAQAVAKAVRLRII
ncbi:autoinducer binding domain-containing protein [Marivita sp. GX14005]|uniref:helix-turn-helix transcriptional regulator n=1 Tax=Marivita sp. GX14005 TaxID=2942276 RepID=UPI002019B028|nr:autoinducer binding domain-containing protein [Marivita sp. GX14005]MCL3883029.1 autoinducer binding domain-containing protein [Marivita sp. GX14005]